MSLSSTSAVASAMGVDTSPRLHLTVDQLPDIKNWKVGQTYTVTAKIEQTAMQEGGFNGKQPYSADFKVVSVNGKNTKSTAKPVDDDEDY